MSLALTDEDNESSASSASAIAVLTAVTLPSSRTKSLSSANSRGGGGSVAARVEAAVPATPPLRPRPSEAVGDIRGGPKVDCVNVEVVVDEDVGADGAGGVRSDGTAATANGGDTGAFFSSLIACKNK